MGKRFLFYYKLFLCYGVLFLMALGATVRAMDAGLACPDWPLCFGKIFPDYQPQVYIEIFHRFIAGFITIAALVLNGYLLREKDSSLVSSKMKTLCWISFALLVVQILMGALTIWLQLHAHVVATHLTLALLLFSVFFWIFWSLEQNISFKEKGSRKEEQISLGIKASFLKYILSFLLILVGIQTLIGSVVAASHAGLVCPEFPLCQGKWFPSFRGLIGLQVLHRLGAYVLTFFISLFTIWAYFFSSSFLRPLSLMLFSMLCLQIGLGIANVLLATPVIVTVFHLVVATMMIMTVLKMLFKVSYFSINHSMNRSIYRGS